VLLLGRLTSEKKAKAEKNKHKSGKSFWCDSRLPTDDESRSNSRKAKQLRMG
jgi:hypothetical protein